jgi:hypothetical protein
VKREQFRRFVIEQLTDSLGVASEFVVDDAFALVDAHPEWSAHPQLLRAQFLLALEKEMPTGIAFAKPRAEIVEKLKTAELAA